MKKKIIFAILTLSAITAITFISFTKKQTKEPAQLAKPLPKINIWKLKKGNILNIFGRWNLTSYGKKDTLKKPIENTKIYIHFKKDGISGYVSPNKYYFETINGERTIKIESDKLIIPAGIVHTEVGASGEIMDQESAYLQLLGQAKSFDAYKNKLIIYCTKENVLIFKKQI